MGKKSNKVTNNSLEKVVADEDHHHEEIFTPSVMSQKKKRKHKEFISNIDNLGALYDENMTSKKKKRKSNPDSDAEFIPKLKKKHFIAVAEDVQALNIPVGEISLSKKKKSSQKSTAFIDTDKWEDEEGTKLLELCLNSSRKKAKCSLGKDLKKIDFATISKSFENKTAKNCRTHLEFLVNKMRKMKNLHQLVSEVLEQGYLNVANEVQSQMPYVTWYRENKDEVRNQMQHSGIEKTMINVTNFARTSYKNLPDEEKAKYELPKLDKKMKSKSEKKKKEISPKLSLLLSHAKSPFEIFEQKRKEKHPEEHKETSIKLLKVKYRSMEDKKKIRYIKASFKSIDQAKEAMAEYEKNNPGQTEDPKIPASKQPIIEETDRYLKYLEAPVPQFKNKEIYYLHQHRPEIYEQYVKDVTSLAKRTSSFIPLNIFNKLSLSQQKEAEKNFKKYIKKFMKELNEWKEEQSPTVVEFYDKLAKYGKVVEAILHPKERKELKPKLMNYVSMPNSLTHYFDEPPQPPISHAELYFHKINKTGTKSKRQREYNLLQPNVKAEIAVKFDKIQENYKERLLDFVETLNENEKRDFLGLRRKALQKVFKKDIFGVKYLCRDFPHYYTEKTNVDAVDQYLESDDKDFLSANMEPSSTSEERPDTPLSEDSEEKNSSSDSE